MIQYLDQDATNNLPSFCRYPIAPPNKRMNLTVASVTPLASVLPSVHPALGKLQAARRPAAFAAVAPAGYARR